MDLEPEPPADCSAPELHLSVGDTVESRYKAGSQWFRGEVVFMNKDGSYDVQYEGGDQEQNVPLSLLRVPNQKYNSIVRRFLTTHDTSGYIKIGTIVEVRFVGRDRWFKGMISRLNEDGTFNVIYDNGRREALNIKRTSFRLLLNEGAAPFEPEVSDTFALSPGTEIEARKAEKVLWASGAVSRAHSDGTYDILFDNQQLECRVQRKYIRLPLE